MGREDLEQSFERLKQGIKRMVSSSVIILVMSIIFCHFDRGEKSREPIRDDNSNDGGMTIRD
jgi:hypothetical protein